MIVLLLASTVLAVPALEAQVVTAPSARALIERLATDTDRIRVELTAKMMVEPVGGPTSESEILVRLAGPDRMRVDFLSPPKHRGKIILQLGSETWLYLPGADRILKARGSPFANLLSGKLEVGGAKVEYQDDTITLVTANPGNEKEGSIRIVFDRATLSPIRRETYGRFGKLLETVCIDERRPWHGAHIPWRVRFVSSLQRGQETRIEVERAADLSGDVEALFSKSRLGSATSGPTHGEK